MNYIKDTGTVKPDLWGKRNEEPSAQEPPAAPQDPPPQTPAQNEALPPAAQPVIYIINADPSMLRNLQEQMQGYRKDDSRRRGGGGSIFGMLFGLFYGIKRFVKGILILAVIITIVIFLTHPGLLDRLVIGILKKTGLYNIIIGIKKLIR